MNPNKSQFDSIEIPTDQLFKRSAWDDYAADDTGDEFDDDTELKVGRSILADIDDRINAEFMSPSVGYTAIPHDDYGRKRFRTIPEDY